MLEESNTGWKIEISEPCLNTAIGVLGRACMWRGVKQEADTVECCFMT